MTDAEQRFWSRVDRAGPDECWEWTAGTSGGGYGAMSVDGDTVYAHRLSFKLHNDEEAEDYVCHTCDNKSCVNPAHLEAADNAKNQRDASVRTPGPDVKLDRDEAEVLRLRYDEEDISQQDLADEYEVSKSLVCRIVNNEVWS